MKKWGFILSLIFLISVISGCSEEEYTKKTNEKFTGFVENVYTEATATQKNVKETVKRAESGEYSSVKASNQIGIAVNMNEQIEEDLIRHNYLTTENEKEYDKLKEAISERKSALALIQGYYDENRKKKEWLDEGLESLEVAYEKIEEVHEALQKKK